MLPLDETDVDYTTQRPKFFPWPKAPASRVRAEVRPDLRVEAQPLRNPIQGSRVEGRGAVVVRGQVTGQGLEAAAAEHAAQVAAARVLVAAADAHLAATAQGEGGGEERGKGGGDGAKEGQGEREARRGRIQAYRGV